MASLKDKDQKEWKADAWKVPGSPLGPGEGVRVFFHAILSQDFGFDPDQHQIFVRGGEELGKPEWNINVCELHVTKPLEQVGALIEGCAILSKQLLDRPVPYKYVVIGNKGSVQDKESEDVNRCLHLKSSLLGSGDWHQYDDIICMKSTGIKKQVLNYVKEWVGNEVVKKKKLAASIMLDRVLSILQTWSTVNLNSFFMQFRQFYSVVSEPMVYEEQAQTWTSPHYTKNQMRQYLWKCLQKHMALLLEKSEDPLPTDFPVRSKLRMGLIALHVAEELKLSLSKHDLGTLCGLLCTNAHFPGGLFNDLSLIFRTSQRWQEYLVSLCGRSMDQGVDLWVGTLPVLHLCMGPRPPGRKPRIQPENIWAALEGLSFSEFREKRAHEKQLLQLMVEKKYLLSVDEDLFRSWFSLLPLSSLAAYLQEFSDYLTRFPERVLDCLLGTWYRLQGHKDVNKNLEDIDKTLKMLLHLLGTFQDKVLQEPFVPSYLTVCLKLHEAVCELTKGQMTHELLASSAEIVCIVIRLKPIVDSEEGPESDTGMRTSVRSVAQGALAATRAWFRGTFKQRIFCNSNDSSVRFTYSEEIQVWRRLVEIRFPEEHGWKESLLGDLEGRLKQERPLSQISAYCSTGWAAAGANDSVSKCFEKCAIEAVGLACQSQTSILDGLSQSNLQRFGILASAVVTKSWPRCNGEAVDDLAEVLKYLLTWPDVKHLFKLYRTDKKVLAHITEDGKKLMATADSVFTKVAEALLSRTVLVEQLQLIRSHMTQFLDIWELKRKSLSPQEEKYDMKKVLDSRWKELQFLQREQSRVDSLLKLCEGVKHWVKVDCRKIAKKHAEDLGRKCLNEVVMASPSPTSLDMEWVTHYNLSAHVREMATTIDLLKDSHIFRTFWAEAARALLLAEEEKIRGGPLVDIEDVYGDLYLPCFNKFRKLYEDLRSGELTIGEVHIIFGVFVNKYDDLTLDLRVMCALNPRDPRDWIQERMGQVREYHHLHLSAKAAKVILEVKETLGLTGDFSLLHFVLRITEASENSRHKKLGQIDRQVISANKLLRDMNEARCQCLMELALAREFVHWVREAVKGINELKVFVDLAFIFAGENDMDMDRVACFHDAVQGYTALLYNLDMSADFHAFMGHLKELWKALENDQHLPSKLRDSARDLGWLKKVKESHGSVEHSSLSLARAINSRGIYVIQVPTELQQISPDTALYLLLPESSADGQEPRRCSRAELKELLNKLMLMSGKKDHHSAEAQVFSEVFCNVQRLLQAFLNLYSAGSFLFRAWKVEVHCCPELAKPVQMNFGLPLLEPLQGHAPLVPLLEALCRQMEHFLGQWEGFLAQKRAEHFHLNYYTAGQLVYLSTELARQPPGAHAAVLAMLSFVKRQCTPQDVVEAFRGPNGGGTVWATQELRTVVEKLPILLSNESGLVGKLGVIMEQFLRCTCAFLPHCLDLEALGRGLARLAARGGPPVMRRLPKGLQAGRPNLIVCSHSEVLPAALAVYMQSPEQPLPTYDEVLLCTPGTTFEDVELLLRRCLSPGAPGRRVYSLLFADQLGYEVARRAEELLQALRTRPHREDFQLVLVCDCEREHCYLPSAFSQHRVPAIPRASLEAARAYLAHHYQVPEGTPSAAAAFRDQMCVGIVASARAGVDSENNSKVMSIPEGKMERSQELKKDDGAPSQPSQPLGAGKRPGGRRGSLQGQAAEGAEASGNKSSGSSAPQDQTRGGAPRGGKDQEGAGPTASARWKEGAAQKLPLPMPQGGPSEPRKDPPAIGQQTGPPASRFFQATVVAAEPAEPGTEAENKAHSKTQTLKQLPAGAPASWEHCQEAKTKGKTAISGEKAKPGNPKEPERGHRSNTAALKDKDQEWKADAREVPGSPLGPGEGVRVFFHAILSKDFGFDPDQHQIFVRGGEELGKPEWNINVCELHVTKPLEQVGALIEGCAVLSKRLLDRPVPYKYVVIGNKGSVQYEFIDKPQDKESEHVNRCLHLKSSLLGSGDWHQYDDIICMKSTGIKKQVLNYVKEWMGMEVVKKKKLAASIMLDRVLSILQTWSTVNLNSFFMQFRQFYSVVSEPMVYEEQAQTWTSPHYTKNQVREYLWKCLQKHMALLLEKSEDPLPTDFPVRSKLRMGLIALHVAMELKLSLSKHDLGTLCGLLCTNAHFPGGLFNDLSLIFRTSQRWREYLVSLCERSMDQGVDLWLGTLPVLHLCMGPRPPGREHRIQPENIWAALEGLSFSEFREKRAHEKQLLQLMVEKKYLLSVDEDLFRSWFSLLPLSSLAAYLQEFSDYLTRFPERVLDCLLGTWYRLQGHKDVNKNLEDIDKTLKMLLHLLGTFQDKVLQEPFVPSYLTVCLKLHEAVCELTKGQMTHELLASSAEIVCIVIRLKPIVDSEEGPESDTGMRTSVRSVAQGALAATRAWFRGTFKQRIFCNSNDSSVRFTYSEEIQVWRRLVEIRFPEEHGWKESLLGDLEGRLKQERPLSQISAYCSTGWAAAGANDSVSKCFEKCAIEAVGLACQSQTSILDGLSQSNLQRFGILASAVVTKSWPRCNGEAVDDLAEVLKYLLTWPDVKHLFKLYRTDKKVLAHITEDGKKLMATADSVFTKVAEALLSRTVLVEQLQLIRSHMTQFLDIWELKRKSLSPQEEKYDMKKVLDSRWKELQFLQREQSRVDSLLKLCEGVKHWVKVDCRKIAKKHAEDLGRKCLNEVVMASPSPTSLDMEWVTHYNLSAHVREMATTIDLLKDSHIFRTFWAEAARALLLAEEEKIRGGPLVDIEDVYGDLYLPCFNKFRKLYEDLRSGELTIGEVHIIFGVFVNKYDDLTLDLRVMCALNPRDPRDWIQERMGQVREYHHLHLSAKAAKVILEVKETLGLTGDFSLLHFVLRITEASENSRHKKLGQIDRQVISANKLLRDMNEARCQCLMELALAREFVHWVREAVKGINELKVFVDLAFIFAGENDMDMDRVACFHDAVQGYTALLYNLDMSADFHAFMGHLKELWKALENDQHLPSKLRDSARDLGWLKKVKESHGSVEHSSLSLARAINSRGIYVIQVPTELQQISPDTALYLLLPESSADGQEPRRCSRAELKELLNKLMLMSGKKDHHSAEAQVFSEVFCNVQRLLQAFLNLYSAGSFLFRAWKVEVHCCPGLAEPVQMNFGLPLLEPLQGHAPLVPLLEALCRQMEHFLGQWEGFLAQKRAEHFHLNYYTAGQLVYLSTELARQPPGAHAAVLAMLSFVKRQCTPQDVVEAFRGPNGGGTVWATQELRTVMEKLPILLSNESGLVGKLGVIMEQFLRCTCAFLPHCLDLEALGRGLARLAARGGPPVMRRLPKGLQAGRPNLIVCSHSEVLPAALAVYMQSPEQPLPTYDEVLLCTPGTTFEDVELLLRRCLSPGAPGRRVYSLLFADQLGYEVARRAEELLQALRTRPHREDFQLVLVCDCEREHCYLPSAFSQHRVPAIPRASLEAARAYLAHHYQVPEGTPSAAAAFRDQMCVGIVASARAGVGKSLYVKRLHETLKMKFTGKNVPLNIIRLIDPQVDENQVLGSLLPFLGAEYQTSPMIFHLDVTSSVQDGVWAFLFKLLVLQYLMDSNGKMWLRSPSHLYVIEILEGQSALPTRSSKLRACVLPFSLLDIFPKVTCRPPKEVIYMELSPERHLEEPGMDPTEFCSETFQRPFQYLKRFYQKQNLDTFQYQKGRVEGTPQECLQHLLFYCGVLDPSWAELRNFALFLNCQLRDCEASTFCDPAVVGDILRGFKNFVVTFMIFMARDFATPTLCMSDQSPGKHVVTMDGVTEEDIAPFSLRRRWESEPHPYLFFNGDRTSMTFIGFHLEPKQKGTLDAIDHLSKKVIKKDVMNKDLYQVLLRQGVPFNVDFDALPRHEKLERLCLALGIQQPMDPDNTYELTTDNMLKILAIEMRFRSGIPVIIMGETGCGKTRLIRFLSDLQRGASKAKTLQLVKVHGGMSADMIYNKVKAAEALAQHNKSKYGLNTILFFDEANTTGAISCIKEVLCDHMVGGRPLAEDSGLHVIAACNPYRKHSPEMIARLEAAGLGYRVRAEETVERLGSIPLRQLVYRVHALPPSLVPLVWDFGQLNNTTERMYIQQIVRRLVDTTTIGSDKTCMITNVLYASQCFMRRGENECSFVSLRDVERCMKVFWWFYDHSKMLLSKLDTFHSKPGDSPDNSKRDPVLWSLVLAVGVCYHASLEKQDEYRRAICKLLPPPYNNSKTILDAIALTQDLFLENVSLRKTIAKNLALKENFFMMVICIELKIPLFLVGKPGSSKSLAKTIMAEAMQGPAAPSELFQSLKQVYLVSFQCSPHSTPQGIMGTFKQCARLQQGRDLEQYVSVVVLDEVGLAEDSPQMPLKALHPLLEDGCIEDDPAPHKKVGFIGISNWALDPAKMNRGIFVSRGSPSQRELIDSARGICASEPLVQERIQGYFRPLASAYEAVCAKQDKEFFGLRDYYSLIKMVFAAAKASNRTFFPQDIAQAVLRNFSGKDEIQALDIFSDHLPEVKLTAEVSTLQLIQQNLFGDLPRAPGMGPEDSESRYLLVLTRNYVALQILQRTLFAEDQQPEIIFGSSFPRDQEYAQICRNINRVKICMETGKMVVLLNLQNLYESLYDALNQYYVYLGGQKYVDLGLGTHRVKCRVHPDFRLIVIEEKDVVCQQFPTPLINRLEKHYLDLNTVLEKWQKDLVEELKAWVDKFIDFKAVQVSTRHTRYSPPDVFIGYHADTCASVVLQVIERIGPGAPSHECYHKVLEDAKLVLLDCATPDAVVRLSTSPLGQFAAQTLSREYYYGQQHNSFADFLQAHLHGSSPERHAFFTEITTFSRLLTSYDCEMLESEVNNRALKPMILSLQQFDTEHSFLKEVRNCLTSTATRKILIIQTDFEDGVHSAQLIASAKYSAINEINKIQGNKACIFVYFITKLSRMESGTSYVGFHGGLWRSVHIDDLRRSTTMVSDVMQLQDVTISQLFDPESEVGCEARHGQEEAMGVETNEPGPTAAVNMETVDMEMDSPKARRGHTQALDCDSLLRSCIQSAVSLLQDPSERSQRNVRRVEILLGLLSEDADNACKASFSRVAKVRIHDLLRQQEESCVFSRKEWVVQEASNPDALQEAGTFRHALWKRIQGVVTPLLASMVSVIDRDSNLELLAKPDAPAWTQELWMFIFSDVKLLNIPLVTKDARSKSDMAHILVQSHTHGLEEVSCAVPFSWRIWDYVEDLWLQAQYISKATGPEPVGKLVEIFPQTPLGRFLARLRGEERQELLRSYLRDFLLLTMQVSTWPELEFLQMALWSCVQQLRVGSPEQELSLPWVHWAYQHFRVRLQNFSRILTIHPPVLDSLAAAARSQDLAGPEMTLDAWAAMACTELMTRDLLKPSPQAWLQAVKSLAVPLQLLCSEGYVQGPGSRANGLIGEVRGQWTRIFSVALFVEHVLLGTEGHSPELHALLTDYVFSLDKCLQGNSDIKTLRPFSAVMATLRECKDRASKTFIRFGVQSCPVCLGDPRSPVCLPCDHVFCLDCIRQWLTPGQMTCPLCLTELPDGFSPTVSQETRIAIEQHARFRHLCTSFFVDLVSTLCFKDNCPPSRDVVQELLSLLFVEKTLLRDAPQRHCEHTKSLSPFDDIMDKTPVIRSVVLKLLLKYSFPEVKDCIQDHLSQLEQKPFLAEDKTELYVLFSSCLEDSIHEKNSALPAQGDSTYLQEDSQFLGACLPRCSRDPGLEASIEYLQETARIRLCLDRACEVLSKLREGSELAEEQRQFLRQVERFCTQSGNDWHRVYLVRRLVSRQGMEFVQSFLQPGHPAQWVLPQEVQAQQEDLLGQMDRYLVHGQEYKAVRDAVGKAVLECKPQAIAAALEACRGSQTHQATYLLLALFREVTTLYRFQNAHLHPKPEELKALGKFIEESQTLSPDMRDFATGLVTNALPLLRTAGPGDGSLAGMVTELAVHTAITLLCGQHRVLEPLRNLAFSPDTMARAFLPTMPQDMLAQARSWKGLKHVQWYTCPRGHPCCVGECGRPMEQSFCIDCGAPVGGQNHKPNEGFTGVQNTADRTQTGHVLGNPPPSDEAVLSDRELSPVVFLLARLLTHLAMLLGVAHSPKALIDIIKPAVRDPGAFLQQHIQRDLQQLMKMLGKSADDTAQVAHLVLCILFKQQPLLPKRFFNFNENLSTKEERNSWEKLLEAIMLPELEHLDKTLLEVNNLISRDKHVQSNPVARIVFEDPATFLRRLPRGSAVHCSKMWSCRTRITVEHLRHVVEQKNGQEAVPVLWRFLQKEAELRLVKFLPEILALQRDLVKQFQNIPEAEYQSIRGFIDSHSSGGLKQLLHSRITVFLSTWNKLRRSLETRGSGSEQLLENSLSFKGEIKLPADYCCADRDLDTEFEVILPRRQGLGLCATALVSYLISLHNEMVYAVEKFSKEEHSYSVDASEVTDLHVISYEVERDLMPLILSNCQYQVVQGGESLQELDLERIQRQVIGRFLQGKPRLRLRGLPTLVYRQDWNYEHLFAAIRSRMPQSPLPHSATSALGRQLQSHSDTCEALSLVEVTLGFLSTAGEDPNMDLNVYLQDKLRMGDQTEQVVKALHRCQLQHIIALWQLLSAHKSEQLLRLQKEPFREISAKYRVELSPKLTKHLRTFLNQSSLDTFLLELHEMILLKLKNPQTEAGFNPDWSLKETLVSYMETKDGDIPPEMEFLFPEEIQLCHCISAWKTAAVLKWARQTR